MQVSQQPDEHREEMSPSRALWLPSSEEDLDDFPEDPPFEEPPREEGALPEPVVGRLLPLELRRPGLPKPWLAGLGRGGDTVAPMPPLMRGEVLTEPSGC